MSIQNQDVINHSSEFIQKNNKALIPLYIIAKQFKNIKNQNVGIQFEKFLKKQNIPVQLFEVQSDINPNPFNNSDVEIINNTVSYTKYPLTINTNRFYNYPPIIISQATGLTFVSGPYQPIS